ncbi:MAG: glycerophosphodiester phosphodiesterase [Actinobacteria bacterium]|nr:glycerophosphodiester phosphodiesterase [Actinomycetota bacterium]
MIIEVRDDSRVERREFLLVSHRGGKGFGPENTLEALEAALNSGVEMLETDVRMSGDGVPFIHHGPFLGLSLLAHMSMQEIKDRAPHVPTLREYLEVAGGRCSLNLEVKRCDPAVLASVLQEAPTFSYLLVSSFDADFLRSFGGTGVGAELGLLSQFEIAHERMLRDAIDCGASVLLPSSLVVSDGLVRAAHAAGLRVIPWTVNSLESLEEMVLAGSDGVITDCYASFSDRLAAGAISRDGDGGGQGAPVDHIRKR